MISVFVDLPELLTENNSVTLFGHRPLILGHISIRLVPLKIKTEGESFDPGLVVIGQTMEIPFILPL